MAKDKKKKKDKGNRGAGGSPMDALKALGQNRLVADVVAAALVATAAALKDTKKAERLASDAGDELTKLSKAGAKRGSALWNMALQIGRESLDALAGEKKSAKAKPRAKKPAAKRAPTAASARPLKATKRKPAAASAPPRKAPKKSK